MEDELQSLQENNTWELVPLPPKRKVVQCKWVFRTKLAAYGSNIKHKVILVAKVYSQVHGVDYIETFALVAKMDSIRLVLALAALKCWEVHHMDVKVHYCIVICRRRYICQILKDSKRILHWYGG